LQTIHIAETPAEAELIRQGTGPFAEMFDRRGIVWDTPGVSPVRYVDRCGAFEARTLAVHCVQVDTTDAELLAARGVSVAHCPKSNGKLATGVAPLRTLLDAGVAVGLGTDSMVSNNAADIFEEMRLAIFQSRNAAHSVAALSAPEALQLATLGGARAIGMDQEIGSLRAGKRADLCVARLDGLNTLSAAEDNPIAALVFGARTSDIALTMVEGSVLYESGKALRLDLPRALIVAKAARANLWRKAERVLGTRH
jgi:5-methylthioadenosine/S-adenosylhomocysteine deaminase